MIRSFTTASAAVISLLVAGMSSAGAAHALGGEQLGCSVGPQNSGTYTTPRCKNTPGATSYEADFLVLNESATSTYSWSVPSQYQTSIVSGCTSSTNSCSIGVPNTDSYITVSVTLTQNAATETLTANARILQSCGDQYC